jgi:AcrR family transcriptional regulator
MRAIAIREDVSDLILDATGRLLERFGYAKMTMDDLAREVGIGKGTIYLHFPSKEEVVLSRIDRVVERLVLELRAIAGSTAPFGERLRAMLVKRVLFRFDAARSYAQSLDVMLASIRSGLLVRRERHFALEGEVFAGLLAEGGRSGAFARADAKGTAEALILATNALLPSSLTARELGKRSDVEERAARIATLLIVGVETRDMNRAARPRPQSKGWRS